MQPLSLSLWAALSAWVAIFGTRELLPQPATVFHKLYQDVEAVEVPACAFVLGCACGAIRRAPRRAVRLGSSAPALLPHAGKGVLGRPSYSST
jgi:hypothetical protein